MRWWKKKEKSIPKEILRSIYSFSAVYQGSAKNLEQRNSQPRWPNNRLIPRPVSIRKELIFYRMLATSLDEWTSWRGKQLSSSISQPWSKRGKWSTNEVLSRLAFYLLLSHARWNYSPTFPFIFANGKVGEMSFECSIDYARTWGTDW